MNTEQVKNWKKVLSSQLGPLAFLLPKKEIENIRNDMQNKVNLLNEEIKKRHSCNGKCNSCPKEDTCIF